MANIDTINIDFVECLTRNNFLYGKGSNINLKAKLCLRLLLFLDSLHDFGDTARTKLVTNTAFKEKIMKNLLIKLLKDLTWILTGTPDTPYLTMLKEFINNMLVPDAAGKTTVQLNENLKIYSIFFGSGNWPGYERSSYNNIHNLITTAPPGSILSNTYFSLIKQIAPNGTRLYFYPTDIKDHTSLNEYPNTENINPEEVESGYKDNIHYGIRCLFMKSAPKGGGQDRELHQKNLHSFVNQLMNYIYQDPNDENEKYIIFIITCLIYFWEPVTNVEGNTHIYIQYDNIALDSYVHDLFFKYIINYSLNCFTIIPTSNHNIPAGTWQFITSIIQYLCFQITSNEACKQKQRDLYETSLTKVTNYNLNTFFKKKVSIIIDAAGKPRSMIYLTQCILDIFKDPTKDPSDSIQDFQLYTTIATQFDAAGVSNLQSTLQQSQSDLIHLINNTEYTKNYIFNITCGGEEIIKIGFIRDKTGKISVVFKRFFSEEFAGDGYPVSQEFSSLAKSIIQFGTTNDIYFLIAKSMGDFGQILFYYLLQYNSGYFSGDLNSLTIFHTLDTWAASICSLFAVGVICEESSDAIKIDEVTKLPYKYGHNKMFVSKTLRDILLKEMTPSVILPTIDAVDENDVHVWSMIPLTPGQAYQYNKREKILQEEIIRLNKKITEQEQDLDQAKIQVAEAHNAIAAAGGVLAELLAAAAAGQVPQLTPKLMEELKVFQQSGAKIISPAQNETLQAAATNIENKLNEKAQLVQEEITPTTDKKRYYYDVDESTDVGVAENSAKKSKMEGGVMTRAMQIKQQQQQLNNDIAGSFQVLGHQISESRNYIVQFTQWLNSHGFQLPSQYIHAGEKFINNVDNYEPVAARTRSKLSARLKPRPSVAQIAAPSPPPPRTKRTGPDGGSKKTKKKLIK